MSDLELLDVNSLSCSALPSFAQAPCEFVLLPEMVSDTRHMFKSTLTKFRLCLEKLRIGGVFIVRPRVFIGSPEHWPLGFGFGRQRRRFGCWWKVMVGGRGVVVGVAEQVSARSV